MNESMNFGNLGFSTVTEEKVDDTPAFANNANETEQKVEGATEEAKDEKVDIEEIKKKDAEAASDFEQTSTAAQNLKNYEEDAANFQSIDFGPMQKYLDDDDVTDISYSNGGQLWLKSLSRGVYRADQQDVDDALMEKIAFQCSNIMGKTFNMAHPFLDSESAELRMNFVHNSIARNGIAVVFRKTPAKIRLEKQKLLNEKYVQLNIHEFLINCVKCHCNIIVCGETGSGKTELVKYLASHTAENEKMISIEDTLELHLDRIYPTRDIVAMKTNNIASYSDVLVTCMRQNPIWILLSEVRSAEAVTAVRNSISSGHYILSTIHADKAESIPHRMYSLLESNIDVEQFLKTIYRYVQIGIFVRGRYKPEVKRFVREIAGVCEFHVTDDEKAEFTNIYLKNVQGEETFNQPSKYLLRFLEGQGADLNNLFGENRSNVTDGMDMSQIKSPTINLDDDPKPKAEETPKEGNNDSPVEEPKKEEVPTEEIKEEPKVEVPVEAPAPEVQEPAPVEEPKQEVQTEEPKQEVQAEEPKQEVQTEEPKVEEQKVEEPVAVATEQPQVPIQPEVQEQKVETPTEEPKTEAPVEEVKAEAPAPVAAPALEPPAQPQAPVEPVVEAVQPVATPAPATPEVNVTVQEAIPEAPVQAPVAAPDDIVAKPMIDIATLQSGNPAMPAVSVDANAQQPAVQPVAPVAAPAAPVQPAAVQQMPAQQMIQQELGVIGQGMVPQAQMTIQQPLTPVAANYVQSPQAGVGSPLGFMSNNAPPGIPQAAPPMGPAPALVNPAGNQSFI